MKTEPKKDAATVPGADKREWEHIEHKEVQELYNILTGAVFYPNKPFRSDEH